MTLAYAARFLTSPYAWPGGELAGLAWLSAAAGLMVLATRRPPEGEAAGLPAARLAWVAGGVALLVLALPFQVPFAHYINLRPLPFLGPLLLPLLPGRFLRGVAPKLVAVSLAGALVAIAFVHHRGFERELRPLRQVLEPMQPGWRVLPLVFDTHGRTFDDPFLDPLLHAPALYHAEKGGVGPYFQELTLFPVRLRREVTLPAPPEYAPGEFRWSEHGAAYDAFVVYRPTREVRTELLRNARLLAAADGWFTFAQREPAGTDG